MSRVHSYIFIVLNLALLSYSVTFDKCQLARQLLIHGFPRHQLEDWVCLIEGESSRRTNVIGGPNWDGSYDHGLFQINDRYWCNNYGYPGKGCNVRCADLRLDNIDEASKCAKKIYKYHGFDAWVAWRHNCRGSLQNLIDCRI